MIKTMVSLAPTTVAMSGLILYQFPSSTPSRAVLLAAKAIGVSLELKNINIFKGEQVNADFVKVNPQHCIPTLNDNGFILWESRAIAAYLVGTYGKDDQLYPKDLKKRALVDQRLYFDSATLFPRIRAVYAPILLEGATEISEARKSELKITLDILELFLEDSKWLAGDNYTLADTAIAASIATLQSVEPGYLTNLPNINKWFKLCSTTLPGFQANLDGARMVGEFFRTKLAEINK